MNFTGVSWSISGTQSAVPRPSIMCAARGLCDALSVAPVWTMDSHGSKFRRMQITRPDFKLFFVCQERRYAHLRMTREKAGSKKIVPFRKSFLKWHYFTPRKYSYLRVPEEVQGLFFLGLPTLPLLFLRCSIASRSQVYWDPIL